jgi:hypothetical protein
MSEDLILFGCEHELLSLLLTIRTLLLLLLL